MALALAEITIFLVITDPENHIVYMKLLERPPFLASIVHSFMKGYKCL